MTTAPRTKAPLPHPPANREFSDWILAGQGFVYDVDTIYTSASNSKGFSETVSFKVPPLFNSLIKEFCAKYADLGYRNASDFLRDAVFHRMYQVMHREDDLQGPLWAKALELALEEALEQELLVEAQRERLIRNMWERVETLVANGYLNDAEDRIEELHDAITPWPKSDRREAALREVADMRKFLESPASRRNVTRLNSRRGA